jgi:hypothetical protein
MIGLFSHLGTQELYLSPSTQANLYTYLSSNTTTSSHYHNNNKPIIDRLLQLTRPNPSTFTSKQPTNTSKSVQDEPQHFILIHLPHVRLFPPHHRRRHFNISPYHCRRHFSHLAQALCSSLNCFGSSLSRSIHGFRRSSPTTPDRVW